MKYFKFWFPLVLYSGIIFYISSRPNLKPPLEGFSIDKIFHLGEYIPFGFLLARAFWGLKQQISDKKLTLIAILGSCLYGMSDEYHQSFVPGRFASGLDVLADTLGGFIGALLFVKLKRHEDKVESS